MTPCDGVPRKNYMPIAVGVLISIDHDEKTKMEPPLRKTMINYRLTNTHTHAHISMK